MEISVGSQIFYLIFDIKKCTLKEITYVSKTYCHTKFDDDIN